MEIIHVVQSFLMTDPAGENIQVKVTFLSCLTIRRVAGGGVVQEVDLSSSVASFSVVGTPVFW